MLIADSTVKIMEQTNEWHDENIIFEFDGVKDTDVVRLKVGFIGVEYLISLIWRECYYVSWVVRTSNNHLSQVYMNVPIYNSQANRMMLAMQQWGQDTSNWLPFKVEMDSIIEHFEEYQKLSDRNVMDKIRMQLEDLLDK